jgi:CRP/FNR family cyclic AMP-dependent transcriptional regulator
MPDETVARRSALLKEVPLFAGLQERELAAVVDDLRPRHYERGETVFHQGDESREIYVVLEGKVRIFRISPSGNETTLDIFSTHDVIGEQAAVEGQPRDASGQAIDAVTLLAMSHERFLYHLRVMPGLALGLIQLLSSKLRWTAAYAESVAQFDAAGRLLHILLLYTERYGRAVEPGRRYVLDLALNQADLASMVGTRREWVNRILNDWRKRGLLEYDNGAITILDLPRVEAERDSRIEANQVRAGW